MYPVRNYLAAVVIAVGLMTFSASAAHLKPVALRCEYRVNPLGVDEARPRLTWRVESDARGEIQTAYQILVASSLELLKADTGLAIQTDASFSE